MLRRIISILTVALLSGPVLAQEAEQQQSWADWLAGVRTEALERGISQATIDLALTDIKPREKIVQSDRSQAEFTETAAQYIDKRVNRIRIDKGREFIAAHADVLAQVEARYGVQARYIVAIWGMETNYGTYELREDAITALATLAYDPRRAGYFREELFAALRILDEGHIAHADMKGSWAGALGQSQFMPSSFVGYAVDFDGDGRKDIWGTEADVFGSIAHYLAERGWTSGVIWGREVRLPEDFDSKRPFVGDNEEGGCRALNAHTKKLPLSEWQKLGVRQYDGGDLPDVDIEASLVQPDRPDGPAFLTYANFRAILGYNCSNLYAISVGHLAETIGSLPNVANNGASSSAQLAQ